MFKCQSCGQMFVIERLAKPHRVKNMDVDFNLTYCGRGFSSELELSGVFMNMQMSLGCYNCDLKSGMGSRLRVHLFIKHGKLNLVTIVPDRGKLERKVG